MKKMLLTVLAIVVFTNAYAQHLQDAYFPDVLNLRGTPDNPKDDSIFIFADQGAWFGFAVARKDEGNLRTGFAGPYFISTNYRPNIWQGPSFARLKLKLDSSSALLHPVKVSSHSYPGRLVQQAEYPGIKAVSTLIFADSNTVLVRTKLQNTGSKKINIHLSWANALFPEHYTVQAMKGAAKIQLSGRGSQFYLAPGIQPFSVEKDSAGYQLSVKKPVLLRPGENSASYLAYSLSKDGLLKLAQQASSQFKENSKRWNGYICDIFDTNKTGYRSKKRRRLAVKSLETLITNWRSPRGDLHYSGLFPSYSYRGFHGFWAWDSWKQAAGSALFSPKLAESQIHVMFDYQNNKGMIPDVIYADSSGNNWRDTKPPLAAWAVWKVYQHSGDKGFLKEIYPKLKKYHKWWYQYRDHDGNGLCEYGSTDGTKKAAKWGSGMDNSVRFDNIKMVQNGPHAWSMNQESVDLNSYLDAEKNYLAKMADVLGYADDAKSFKKHAAVLKERINRLMYDSESGYYYDKKLGSDSLIKVQGPAGWIPLWADIASSEQAKSVRKVMMDSSRFFSYVPLPTLQISSPKLEPQNGYWRGPVWLDQFYFGVKGLLNYGYDEDASVLVNRLFNHAEGLLGQGPIRENYNPLTGAGLNSKNFSWSAASILLMLENTNNLE